VIARVGGVIFAFGILVLLFVAFQLWGTGISTRLHQEQLRRQFDHELALAHRAVPKTTTTTTAPVPTTTTTTPTRGVASVVPGDVPADGQPIGTIDIPAIGANYVVVQGTTTHDLQLGPGHYANTAIPGQPGNAAIAGHRTTYLAPFYNLSSLVAGDPIYITTTQGRFRYDVTDLEVVSPTDVAVLNQTATPTLTLTTCNPRYSAAQRLVVVAALETPPAPVPVPPATTRTSARHRETATGPRGLGLAGESGSAWPAIAWGAGCAVVSVLVWLLARRRSTRLRRWAIYGLGVVPLLVVLFFFFQSVSPLLPASF
jgi:sortase A